MDNAAKRKYKQGDFVVNIGTCVSAGTFDEIEKLTRALGTTKADLIRRLVLRGLAEYACEVKSTSDSTVPPTDLILPTTTTLTSMVHDVPRKVASTPEAPEAMLPA